MTNRPDAFTQNQRLGRGVNVIGYDPLWRSRAEGRMQNRHFRLIKEAGFNSVRINLHPFSFMGPAPDHAISPAWIETLDWAVEQSLANDLVTILDMHEFTRMGRDPQGNKTKFLATWVQLAARYQDSPDSVLFEILNEPCQKLTPELWNQFLQEAYATVRATNPHRTLIVGPAHWNGLDHLDSLELPQDDRNIIVTGHYYHPMPFTHQGAGWTEFESESGIEWHGTPQEQRAIIRDFERAQRWAEAHNCPLFLGEFGAYDRADMDSRARYTDFVARQAERLGWSWAYWQFDADFVVYDIPNDAWVVPIRDALIPPSDSAKP